MFPQYMLNVTITELQKVASGESLLSPKAAVQRVRGLCGRVSAETLAEVVAYWIYGDCTPCSFVYQQ